MENGELVGLDFGDSYEIYNPNHQYPPAPKPMQKYMNILSLVMRDANWSPDFPSAAVSYAIVDGPWKLIHNLARPPGKRPQSLALLSMTRENAPQHLQLWQQVVRASPAYGADMSLYLAGMAAWISGDGGSATIALERSLAAEPQHVGPHPARLLEQIIDNVIPPTAWDSLRRDMADHAHPDVKQALPAPDQPAPGRGWPPARPHQPGPRNEPTHRKPPVPGISI